MNNFTREELLELESCLIFKMDRSSPTPSIVTHDLIDKIQFMIENYCKHNCEGGEVEIFVDTCRKCNAYLLREFYHE